MAKQKKTKKIGRNDPCPCGSGKKYKKCCLHKDEQHQHKEWQKNQALRESVQRNWGPFGEKPDPEDYELFEDDPTVPRRRYLFEPEEEYEKEFGEEEEAEERPREHEELWEAPEIKKISKEVPELSEAERAQIATWWDSYKKFQAADDLQRQFDMLLAEQAELIVKIDLPEILFRLADGYIEEQRYEEYAALLMRLRQELPEVYLRNYGYFDRDIISYLVIADRKEEIPEFLGYFREYPSHDPDNLFQMLRYLMLTNCQEVLIPFVRDICHEVCYSPDIVNGVEILKPVVMSYWMPYLRPDVSDEDLSNLAGQLKTIKGPVNEKYYNPEVLKEHIQYVVGEFSGWDIADCPTIRDVYSRYYRICQNFMGFLHREKGKDWLAADFFRDMMFSYFEYLIPEGKRPKEAFIFTKNKIDRTVAKIGKDMLFTYPTRLFGALNAVYYFAEYLAATDSIPEERAQEVQTWCAELFKGTYPSIVKHYFLVKAFEQFPV